MASETLNIDITAEDKATPVIKGIDKQIEALTKRKTEIEIDADSADAQRELKEIDKQLAQLQGEKAKIVVDAKIDGVLSAFDKVAAEAKETAEAADALGRALGPELAAKADTTAIVADLQKMGLSLDDIKGNADQLGGKLKELSDQDVGGKLGNSLGTARGKMDELSASADSSKSVMANMIGNTTQDLGALTGVAGSAGVAIGQMGEYMADALSGGAKLGDVLLDFGKVAGPIALISVGVGLLTQHMANQEAAAKRVQEVTKDVVAALETEIDKVKELASAADGNNLDALAEAQTALNDALLDGGDNGDKLTKALGVLDISANDAVTSVKGLKEGTEEWISAQLQAKGATKEMGDMIASKLGTFDDWDEAMDSMASGPLKNLAAQLGVTEDEAKQFVKALADMDDVASDTDFSKIATEFLTQAAGSDEATASLIRQAEATAGVSRTSADSEKVLQAYIDLLAEQKNTTEGSIKGLQEWADKTAKAITRMHEFNQVMQSSDWGKAAVVGATSAMSEYTEQQFGLININADAQESYDNFSETIKNNAKEIKDHTKTFDVSTEAGRANQQALEDVAKTMDTKLAAAYADSGGDMDVFKTKAGAISDEAVFNLMPALKGSGITAEELATKLGMTEGDWEARFKLSGAAEAQAKLDLLNISLDDFDDPVARQAYMDAIVQGDYVLALKLAQTMALGNKDVRYGIDVYTRYHTSGDRGSVGSVPPEFGAKGGTAGRRGMIAGEAGPEYAKMPGQATVLLDQPTLVPPGTRVTSARKTRQILARKPKRYANGTQMPAPLGLGAMTFQFHQHAPIYGVSDLDRHLEKWSHKVAQQISVGRRN